MNVTRRHREEVGRLDLRGPVRETRLATKAVVDKLDPKDTSKKLQEAQIKEHIHVFKYIT